LVLLGKIINLIKSISPFLIKESRSSQCHKTFMSAMERNQP
jgi:hypothetical protein